MMGPIVQNIFGYHIKSLEVGLADIYIPDFSRVLQSMWVDGWFPLFPWLGLSFFSIALFRAIFNEKSFHSSHLMMMGGSLLMIGLFFLFLPNHFFANLANGGIIDSREGYSEIFYRPTLAFISTAIGFFMLLICLSQFISKYSFSRVIGFLGKYSLFIYILHQVIGSKVIAAYLEYKGQESITSGLEFFYWVCFTFICITICCQIIEFAKKFHRPRSVFLQVLIGK
jgi:glucan phosphoethanolaminetransferase (alkaline phosphatase superfamily)